MLAEECQEVGETTEGATRWQWAARARVAAAEAPDKAPGDPFVVRSVSWDTAGICLALTDAGLRLWNGTGWISVSVDDLPDPDGMRFVQRSAAGTWIVGGDLATLAVYRASGLAEVRNGPDLSASYRFASGDLDDLVLVAGEVPGEGVVLYAGCGRRWLKPLALPELSFVTGLSRVDDEEWLVVGRLRERGAGVFRVRPLLFETERLAVPNASSARAIFASAGSADRKLGLAVGNEGTALWWDGLELTAEGVPGAEELSACGLDSAGRGWAASAGDIWIRDVQGRWAKVRQDSRPDDRVSPVVSFFAEPGLVTVATADGGMIEGRRVPAPPKRKAIPRPEARPAMIAARPVATPAPPAAYEETRAPPAYVETLEPPPVELIRSPETVELFSSPPRSPEAFTPESTPIDLVPKRRRVTPALSTEPETAPVIELTRRKPRHDDPW